MHFLKNSVWLSTSSQELRPSVLLDTFRPGTIRQTVVARPTKISHFSREAGWITTTFVVQISLRQSATSCQCSTGSTDRSLCQEAGNWQRWWLLFLCSALPQDDPKYRFPLGCCPNVRHLSKRINEQGCYYEGSNHYFDTPLGF